MKTRIAINLFLLAVIFRTANLYADWKSDWEQTVAAAKKEGRLNLYVGRYGQAALLDEFQKDYPEIKIAPVNGTGDQLATRIAAEVRAGKTIADIYSGGPNSSYSLLYRGKVLDSIKSAFILPEVLDESKWYGGKHIFTDSEDQFIFVYIALPGVRGLSYNSNLVNAKEFKSYWENPFAAVHRDRTQRQLAVLFLPARARAGVYQARFGRHGCYIRRSAHDHRLAGGGEVRHLPRLPANRESLRSGITGGRFRNRGLERRATAEHRRRFDQPDQRRPPSQRGARVHQLVSLAQGTDCHAKVQ
jgi:hypothetical protein